MKVDIVGTVSYSEAVETGSFVPDLWSNHGFCTSGSMKVFTSSSPTNSLHQATRSDMLDPGPEHLYSQKQAVCSFSGLSQLCHPTTGSMQ